MLSVQQLATAITAADPGTGMSPIAIDAKVLATLVRVFAKHPAFYGEFMATVNEEACVQPWLDHEAIAKENALKETAKKKAALNARSGSDGKGLK